MGITAEAPVKVCLRFLVLALASGPVRVCWKYEPRAKKEVLHISPVHPKVIEALQTLPEWDIGKILPAHNGAEVSLSGCQVESEGWRYSDDVVWVCGCGKLLKEKDNAGLNRLKERLGELSSPII